VAKERKSRISADKVQLEMTPMIDVVFQLMIFFIVTLKQEDILAHLDITRPAPDSAPPPQVQVQDLLTIQVYREGYVLQGRRVALEELERQLKKLASYSTSVSVIIKCTADSPHAYLMRVLDVCAAAGLRNLNVFSM
jgi:biopolymer transport protein ExbD